MEMIKSNTSVGNSLANKNFSISNDRVALIALNNEIALCAKRKDLEQAMDLYRDALQRGVANSHTFAAAVNANIRCWNTTGAEEIIAEMARQGRKRDVIILTTLMKGYCNDGNVDKSITTLREMDRLHIPPNVRTINTILRGCVQVGNVRSAEEVFNDLNKKYKIVPDISCWEYMISLYCQVFQLDKALPLIGRISKTSLPEMLIGLVNMNVNIARSAALLGEWKTCRKSLKFIDENVDKAYNDTSSHHNNDDNNNGDMKNNDNKKQALGGKRAWKSNTDEYDSREKSLLLYREHLDIEIKNESKRIDEFMKTMISNNISNNKLSSIEYIFPFFLRIFSFHELQNFNNNDNKVKKNSEESVNATNEINNIIKFTAQKFGLTNIVQKVKSDEISNQKVNNSIKSIKTDNNEKKKNITSNITNNIQNNSRFQSLLYNHSTIRLPSFDASTGMIDFLKLFNISSFIYDDIDNNNNSEKQNHNQNEIKPIKMEICSGGGEWAVEQARNDPNSNWLTVELRHDRVYQTFTKAIFSNVTNLFMICADAMKLLPNRIPSELCDALFVNHPEPPQQTGGLESQGNHLLTKEFFIEASRILRMKGIFTIVTDNLWYGKFLLRIISSLISQNKLLPNNEKSFVLKSLLLNEITNYYNSNSNNNNNNLNESQWVLLDAEEGVSLYVGKPGYLAGHIVEASSYFDRLWKKKQLNDRYFIVLGKGFTESLHSSSCSNNNKKRHPPIEND
eukprot:gene16761-22933_t